MSILADDLASLRAEATRHNWRLLPPVKASTLEPEDQQNEALKRGLAEKKIRECHNLADDKASLRAEANRHNWRILPPATIAPNYECPTALELKDRYNKATELGLSEKTIQEYGLLNPLCSSLGYRVLLNEALACFLKDKQVHNGRTAKKVDSIGGAA